MHINKRSPKGGMALILAICLMLGLMMYPAEMARADLGIQEKTGTIIVNDTVIGFAGYEWYVIGYDGDGIDGNGRGDYATLFLKTGQSGGIPAEFDYVAFRAYLVSDYEGDYTWPNDYNDSTLQRKMVAIANDIRSANSKEYGLIIPRTLTASDDMIYPINGEDVPNQRLWPLSYDEWYDVYYGNSGSSVMSYSKDFWLRSPDPFDNIAWLVLSGGGTMTNDVGNTYPAARPAFNLDLESVLFTSDASGTSVKSATVGSDLLPAQPVAQNLKLTVWDNTLNLDVDAEDIDVIEASTYAPGTTIDIPYENATVSADYISCVLTDSSGVLYYGKLAENYAADGAVSVEIPPALADGRYTLKLFTEECNGDNETDFASNPIEISLTVESNTPALNATPGSIAFGNVNTNSTSSEKITVTGSSLSDEVTYRITGDTGAFSLKEDHWNNTAGGGLVVTFQPVAAKSYNASLTITSPGAQDVVVPLTGSGVSSGGGSSSTNNRGGGSASLGAHSVQFDPTGGSPTSSILITENGRITPPVDPTRAGYTFAGWYIDARCTTLYDFTLPVTGSFTLYAGWQPLAEEEATEETLIPYIAGYPDGTFRPDGSVTRGEAAQLLYNLVSNGLISYRGAVVEAAAFGDVAETSWYYDAVLFLSETDAVSGYGDGTFRPDEPVTRAEFTAMTAYLLGLDAGDNANFFDVSADYWASGAIAAMENAGFIGGYPDGNFGPDNNMTRAQVVAVLNNVLDRDVNAALFDGLAMPFDDVPKSHWAFYEIMTAAVAHSKVSQ